MSLTSAIALALICLVAGIIGGIIWDRYFAG